VGLPGEGLLIYHIDDTMIDNCRDCDLTSCAQTPRRTGASTWCRRTGCLSSRRGAVQLRDANDFFPGGLPFARDREHGPGQPRLQRRGYRIRMTNILGAADGQDNAPSISRSR